MKIIADRILCVGGGQCVLNAPDVFDQDDESTVVLLHEDVTDDEVSAVEMAVLVCPGRALRLESS